MASQTISPADRIRDLSAINAEVAELLQSAGHAINSLTDRPLITGDGDAHMQNGSEAASIDKRKQAFAENTQGYYTHLQAIVARLRRQAYALEEAGIIAPEASSLAGSAQQRQSMSSQGQQRGQATAASVQETERITNGGLGNLDVGWLNSRGNKVGVEKESELIDEAKKLLEESLKEDGEVVA
ncbi:uncharacterized protein LTR77_003303 [Saxophila tyrrhenica]|uniref:Mediator of RNA polymerase II transcription subunit 11 n=1 Tax=Saxophila tyrrhenica TaxID=1690608 RepID=A0AAV9PGZ9_9PEZI|nr:hypothetical protein LTR77_003303 [Saxophila tyrrhenica]